MPEFLTNIFHAVVGFDYVSFIPRAVMQGVPLLLGSTGLSLAQRLPEHCPRRCSAEIYLSIVNGTFSRFFSISSSVTV